MKESRTQLWFILFFKRKRFWNLFWHNVPLRDFLSSTRQWERFSCSFQWKLSRIYFKSTFCQKSFWSLKVASVHHSKKFIACGLYAYVLNILWTFFEYCVESFWSLVNNCIHSKWYIQGLTQLHWVSTREAVKLQVECVCMYQSLWSHWSCAN